MFCLTQWEAELVPRKTKWDFEKNSEINLSMNKKRNRRKNEIIWYNDWNEYKKEMKTTFKSWDNIRYTHCESTVLWGKSTQTVNSTTATIIWKQTNEYKW